MTTLLIIWVSIYFLITGFLTHLNPFIPHTVAGTVAKDYDQIRHYPEYGVSYPGSILVEENDAPGNGGEAGPRYINPAIDRIYYIPSVYGVFDMENALSVYDTLYAPYGWKDTRPPQPLKYPSTYKGVRRYQEFSDRQYTNAQQKGFTIWINTDSLDSVSIDTETRTRLEKLLQAHYPALFKDYQQKMEHNSYKMFLFTVNFTQDPYFVW